MGSQPKAPDPYDTAQAQMSANIGTAAANMSMNTINQNGPWGSIGYEQTGTVTIQGPDGKPIEVPRYTQTTTLSPEQQALYDRGTAAQGNIASLAQQMSGSLGNTLSKPMDTSGLPDLQSNFGSGYNAKFNTKFNGDLGLQTNLGLQTTYAGADDFSADRDAYTNALLARGAGDRASQEADLRTTLANKGIREGTAAWDSEMERLARQNTDERYAAYLAGGQEQARMVEMARNAAAFGNNALTTQGNFANNAKAQQGLFGLSAQQAGIAAQQAGNDAAMASAQFNNAARAQGLQERTNLRNQPLNELTSLLGQSQVQAPSYQGTPQVGVANTNVAGLVQQDYQNRLSASQGAMGGLFGLGGSILGAAGNAGGFGALFSDERLKTDIKRVGTTDSGTPIYTYRYIWGGPVQMGVMAQDVPEAAIETESGYLAVEYGKVQ